MSVRGISNPKTSAVHQSIWLLAARLWVQAPHGPLDNPSWEIITHSPSCAYRSEQLSYHVQLKNFSGSPSHTREQAHIKKTPPNRLKVLVPGQKPASLQGCVNGCSTPLKKKDSCSLSNSALPIRLEDFSDFSFTLSRLPM